MEYNEYNDNENRKRSSSIGFYAIIGCCLVILGAVAWFAVAKFTRDKITSKSSSENQSNYSSNDNSSNNSTNPDSANDFVSDIIDTPSSQTAGEKSDVPYSSQETTTTAKKTFILPVEGQVLKGYSDTALQFSSTFGDMRLHTGIDIKCEKNSQIKACGGGTVTDIKDDSSYGKVITIDHGDGIILNYCGLNSISVDVGTNVSTGDIIGTVGSIPTESSDGVHLHLSALIDGKISSPLEAVGLT